MSINFLTSLGWEPSLGLWSVGWLVSERISKVVSLNLNVSNLKDILKHLPLY